MILRGFAMRLNRDRLIGEQNLWICVKTSRLW